MPENERLRRAWEELPKNEHGREMPNRHPDVRPEWIMGVIESPDTYEWLEYSATPEEELRIWRIQVGWVSGIATWIKVVFEERETVVEFCHSISSSRPTGTTSPERSDQERSNMTVSKPQPESKEIRLGGRCLCGCGEVTTPKSYFRQGHDMRVKGMLSRLEKSKFEERFRLPDVLVARATVDAKFQVHGYDSETILRLAAVAHSELKPTVRYYPDTQTLDIENGARRAVGEQVAKSVVVFYAEEEGGELDHNVTSITIDNAEVTLKPFVDAILAKYGVEPQQRVDASKAKTL